MAALGFAALFGSASLAEAQDRSLKLYFVHTGERATITYKRNGRFDPAGLAKINRLLRDWRRNENARMDPRLLDIVWQLYDRTNARDFIHVVSAYRSPATNAMLRGRSRTTGVAKKSQHMLGKAMDFYIPGVKLSTLRGLAMQMQAGGVGYYPTSGSPRACGCRQRARMAAHGASGTGKTLPQWPHAASAAGWQTAAGL